MKKIAAYSLAMFAPCAIAFAAEPTGTEWKEPENLSFGREERRAAFSSFDTLENALKILPEFSERTISLDSETAWKFKWSPDPASRPVGFEKPDYDGSGWETIKVPCSWQAYGANGKGGWGTALYVNQTYPFKRDQPDVMGEPPKDWTSYAARNPVGSYRRDFDVPEKWNGQEIFLKFDAVDSFFYLWVNGEYVGFSKDSRNPAEFNVTKFVKPGKNVVALEVYRYSDGSYLEDQDMFRLSGIARSTWLLARPKTRIRDFTVTPRPADRERLDGDWVLDVRYNVVPAGTSPMFGGLFDMDDMPVACLTKSRSAESAITVTVKGPKLWSAEEPNCYKLLLRCESEYVSCLVGFRTSEIKNGRYYFNNEKIKFRGVNRSESDPMYGHYVPRERQLQDIRLMKEANINHVRNSHYPQDDYWYYLCDIYGIYVLDEANVESHGYYYGEASLSHRKEWEKATVARNLDMVRRNRNHPSVVFWSLGNEAGPGENFAAASAAIKEMDPSRPIQYERDNSVADVDSNQYPGVDWTVWKSNDHKAKKPFYISEYAHNMCNAMGNLKDYQDAIESSDVILGAAIWDWVDQGLYKSSKFEVESSKLKVESSKLKVEGSKTEDRLIIAYGGDFGDKPNDGQFVMNGTVLSDRTPEPGYYEVQHVFQPFAFELLDAGGKVAVRNLNYFRNAAGHTLHITVLGVNGPERISYPLDIPPRDSRVFMVKGMNAEAVFVRCEITLDEDDGILKGGHVVANGQFNVRDIFDAANRIAVKAEGRVEDVSNSSVVGFRAGGVEVRFDRASGALVSYVKGGREFLLAPMTVDAFRAPSSNEVGLGDRWAQAGLRELVQKATSISEVTTNPDGSKSFVVVADVRGKQKERIVGFGGNNGKQCEIVPVGAVAQHDPHFVVAQRWTMFGDGNVACQSEIRSRGRVMELARIGYRFTLDKGLGKVNWFGAGPFENYPDRRSGAFTGWWSTGVDGMVERYAKPQDMGMRCDTAWASLMGSSGMFMLMSLGEPFAFSAIPYSPTELVKTMHPQELPAAEKVEFGVYAAVRGLGGASCGPGPMGRDIVRNNKAFVLDFMIGRPLNLNLLPYMPHEGLPPDVRTGEDIVPTVVACTSAEPGEGDADHLVDGDLSTIWHSQYGVTLTKYPHAVTVDLGRTVNAKGVSIWQRQNGPNGNVKDFKFEVSADGKQWREVIASQLKPGAAEQKFAFAAPSPVRFWRFTGLNEHGGREFASLAEIRVE